MKYMLRRSFVGISVVYCWLFIKGPNVCFDVTIDTGFYIHFFRVYSHLSFFSTFLPSSFLQLHIQTTSFKVSPLTSNPESLYWFIIDISLTDGWHQATEGFPNFELEEEEEDTGASRLKCEVWHEWTSRHRPSSLSLWWDVRIPFSGDVLTDS